MAICWFVVASTALSLSTPLTNLRRTFSQPQSAVTRAIAEEAIAELTSAGTPPQIAASDLNGRWRLLWSSQTADVNPFATPDAVLGGKCYQEIDIVPKGEQPSRLRNIVQWAPRWRLVGGATIEPMSGSYQRSILSVDVSSQGLEPQCSPRALKDQRSRPA